MHCKACDILLEDFELTRKDKETGEYIDLCSYCYKVSEEALVEQQSESVSFVDMLNIGS